MAVLVLAEVQSGALVAEATARAVTGAATLGEVTVLVAGPQAAAQAAAHIAGVTRVLLADDPQYDHQLAEPLADLLVQVAPDFSHIVAPATATGKNVMPRVAALLDVMVLADVIAVLSDDTFVRPVYAGNAVQTVRSGDAVKVITLRTSAFAPAAPADSAAPIAAVSAPAAQGLSSWIEDKVVVSGRPDLSAAPIVVSGGRGFGSEEGFAMLEALADKLGAAIGASRAAVDSGYAANDLQVGQTGKIVAPRLYIAIGISGAIQHLAGMKDSQVIVAINKDPEAPIFRIADYGLVADLFTAVPELTAKL
ncbi:electron transfer flavoprotein, alpha subunit [Ketogulonicigenium robustum]|uniref:Electron transfer flavoprotein subunit alpha n=1 Tax=Ketogulonicigenium robustum TaxID=92947 RepID=A0A1W6NX63_9RHOB|nr:FAD-binding protein [Ketogulonicigenium robustum]ARO13597.1 electron transfer flavoprotein, alpha subunit [Ketogulonicigenium robustum]